jgi:hypothetical protein
MLPSKSRLKGGKGEMKRKTWKKPIVLGQTENLLKRALSLKIQEPQLS